MLYFAAVVLAAQLCPTLLQFHRLQPSRHLCPWDFPGKNTEVGCYFLFLGIFLTQGSNSPFLHWQVDSLPLSHQASPHYTLCVGIYTYVHIPIHMKAVFSCMYICRQIYKYTCVYSLKWKTSTYTLTVFLPLDVTTGAEHFSELGTGFKNLHNRSHYIMRYPIPDQ